jgi:exodeoxyribonuclease VII large subunit
VKRNEIIFVSQQASRTPTEIATEIKAHLRDLGEGQVEGEVSDFKRARSGHCYFNITDGKTSLRACLWKGRADQQKSLPKDGDLIQAHYEKVDFYMQHGSLSLIIKDLKQTDEGELLRRREQVLRRLSADGLCDQARKKPLPAFPRAIGVVAGHDSDAKADVVTHLRKRFKPQKIVFCAALVQGIQSPQSVIGAIAHLQMIEEVETIIIARGGGSIADLSAFDDEDLCRAISACPVPIITSIGHTKDRLNCDHVAAAYAHVPARAAELAVVKSMNELLTEFDYYGDDLDASLQQARQIKANISELLNTVAVHKELWHRLELVTGTASTLNYSIERKLAQADKELIASATNLDKLIQELPKLNQLLELRATLAGAKALIEQELHQLKSKAAYLGQENNREARRSFNRYRDLGAGGFSRKLSSSLSSSFALRKTRVDSLVDVMQARDFRGQGWIIARDKDGKAITKTKDTKPGQVIELHLSDGQIDVKRN